MEPMWKDDKRHGKGKQIESGGDMYAREWVNDLRDGPTLSLADTGMTPILMGPATKKHTRLQKGNLVMRRQARPA
jgi:hypothetical protein